MTKDDIDSWLKAAADNKITTKNTWSAPIIDHFSNLDEFKEKRGINFQRVTTTLDGCVTVYSTRVDNITEDADKLLDSLNHEDETEKYKGKKKKQMNTLEVNPQNLIFKESGEPFFNEPLFFKLKESIPVLSVAKVHSNGLLTLGDEIYEECLNLGSYDEDLRHLYNENNLCPTLNEINPDIYHKLFDLEEIETRELDGDPVFIDDNYEAPDYDDRPGGNNEGNEEYISTIKGWAGPEFWRRLSQNRKKMTCLKPKVKTEIDFLYEVDKSAIYETGNILIKPEEIVQRRDVKNVIAEDFAFSVSSLYKCLVSDVSFRNHNETIDDHEDIRRKMNDLSICVDGEMSIPIDNSINVNEYNDIPEEIEIDHKKIENSKISKKLLLKYRRVPKKVDIDRLKSNVLKTVDFNKKMSLKSVFDNISQMYTKDESSEISVHYCILSLLFLAHEKNLQLENHNNNVSVVSKLNIS